MFRAKSLIVCCLVVQLLTGCATTAPQKAETVFYPPLPQQPRLQFLTTISTEDDLGKKAGAFREFVVGKEQALKGIARAMDVGSVKGKLYVSDQTFKRIISIDLAKGEFAALKDEKSGALKQPFGMHVTAGDVKYVADGERKQVVVFGPDDGFVRTYGKEGQFERPLDVAVFGDRVYVVDNPRHAVLVLDKESGETVQTIGGRGTEAGKMDRPSHARVDRQGNLFVNDSFNFRIQKFDPQGNFLKEFGYSGATVGGFARPKGLDLSPDGKQLYVVDAAFENVQIFDEESTDVLLFFGAFGNVPGSLYLPSALFIDDKNLDYFQRYADKDFKIRYLVIASSLLGEKKLSIYGFGDWIGEKTPEMAPKPPRTPEKGDKSAKPAKPAKPDVAK